MNIYKIVFLNLCFLMIAKFNYLAAEPDGLRCQFAGKTTFILKRCATDFIKREIQHPKSYGASSLDEIKLREFTNGDVWDVNELKSDQWVWIDDRISKIRITLTPGPSTTQYPHGDVYFFNIFKKTLTFKVERTLFERLKHNFHIIRKDQPSSYTLSEIEKPRFIEDDNSYIFTLEPGQALRYPAKPHSMASFVSITLE